MSFILVLFKFKDKTLIERSCVYILFITIVITTIVLECKKREKYLVIIKSNRWTLTRNIFNWYTLILMKFVPIKISSKWKIIILILLTII